MGRENRSDRGASGYRAKAAMSASRSYRTKTYFGAINPQAMKDEDGWLGGYVLLLIFVWWLIRAVHSKSDKRFKQGFNPGSTSFKGWLYMILWAGLWLGGYYLFFK